MYIIYIPACMYTLIIAIVWPVAAVYYIAAEENAQTHTHIFIYIRLFLTGGEGRARLRSADFNNVFLIPVLRVHWPQQLILIFFAKKKKRKKCKN